MHENIGNGSIKENLGSQRDVYDFLNHSIEFGKDEVDLEVLKVAKASGEINQDQYNGLVGKFASRTLKESYGLAFTADQLAKEKESLEQKRNEYEVALEKAGIDGLTGLLRYEKFSAELEKLISELKYSANQIPKEQRRVAMKAIVSFRLDINNFKRFNEKPYNHDVGDQALQAIAAHLFEMTKKGDLLGRVGGDEFAIVMPIFEDGVDFEKLFKNVKERLNKNLFIKFKNDTLKITASVGYSVTTKGEKNAKQLLTEADLLEREDKNRREDWEDDYSI